MALPDCSTIVVVDEETFKLANSLKTSSVGLLASQVSTDAAGNLVRLRLARLDESSGRYKALPEMFAADLRIAA